MKKILLDEVKFLWLIWENKPSNNYVYKETQPCMLIKYIKFIKFHKIQKELILSNASYVRVYHMLINTSEFLYKHF